MKILLLSPHTDDVEIGAGGLISRMQSTGQHQFRWIVFSSCADSLPSNWPPDTLKSEFQSAAEVLRITDVDVLDYRVRNFPSHRQGILEKLMAVGREFRPDLVVAPCVEDVHQDHWTIAIEAARAFKNSATILGYEQPWNTVQFAARVLVRISGADLERKWQAISSYRSQLALGRPYVERESVFAWARARGSQCGSQYAEAFDLPRCIV